MSRFLDAHGQGQAKQDQRKRGSTIMPEPDTTGGSLLVPSLADNDAIEIGQAIRRAHGRGAGKPQVLRDIHPPQRQRRCCGGRFPKAFGRRPAWLAMPRIAAPRACSPKALGNRLNESLICEIWYSCGKAVVLRCSPEPPLFAEGGRKGGC